MNHENYRTIMAYIGIIICVSFAIAWIYFMITKRHDKALKLSIDYFFPEVSIIGSLLRKFRKKPDVDKEKAKRSRSFPFSRRN